MAAYVITPANVKKQVGAFVAAYIAGETIVAGNEIAINALDSKAYLLDVSDPAVSSSVGMALNGATIDQPMDVIQDGLVDVGVVGTVGDVVVASNAVAGSVVPYGDLLATNLVQVLGFFETTSLLRIRITNLNVLKG